MYLKQRLYIGVFMGIYIGIYIRRKMYIYMPLKTAPLYKGIHRLIYGLNHVHIHALFMCIYMC